VVRAVEFVNIPAHRGSSVCASQGLRRDTQCRSFAGPDPATLAGDWPIIAVAHADKNPYIRSTSALGHEHQNRRGWDRSQ
jgi:hypothetical protein